MSDDTFHALSAQCETYAARIKLFEAQLTEAHAALNAMRKDIEHYQRNPLWSPDFWESCLAWREEHAAVLKAAKEKPCQPTL